MINGTGHSYVDIQILQPVGGASGSLQRINDYGTVIGCVDVNSQDTWYTLETTSLACGLNKVEYLPTTCF